MIIDFDLNIFNNLPKKYNRQWSWLNLVIFVKKQYRDKKIHNLIARLAIYFYVILNKMFIMI